MSIDMQGLFKEAAKIAGVVPESMQEAAFHRALDMLTESEQALRRPDDTQRRTAKKRSQGGSGAGDAATAVVDRVARVMAISRESAGEVDQETSVQGRSIALLVVAKRETDVDGLTATEIARILTEKFRSRTTRQAVQQAMDAAGNMIDHRRDGRATVYRVMQTGEDWLGTPAPGRTAPSGRGRSRRRAGANKTAATPRAKTTDSVTKPTTAKKTTSPPTGRRTAGPKAVLESLIDDGYFSEPRGLGDMKQHIRDHRAIAFETSDLSPTLTRLLRENKLKRSKVENQYVYTAS